MRRTDQRGKDGKASSDQGPGGTSWSDLRPVCGKNERPRRFRKNLHQMRVVGRGKVGQLGDDRAVHADQVRPLEGLMENDHVRKSDEHLAKRGSAMRIKIE